MLSCVFEQCLDKNTYILSCEDKKYKVKMDFWDVEKPKQGDQLLINAELLKEAITYSVRTYVFKLNRNINPKIVKEGNIKEFIVVKISNKVYVLKRVYG